MSGEIEPFPASPITALGQFMATLREMYESARKAGFNDDQAMQIVRESMRWGQQQ